jgi:nitronate monooxygenase
MALRGAGIILIATATSLDEARLIEQSGLDAVIAQGVEAGGHRGIFDTEMPDERFSTFALTRLLVREISLPVIAAGGIMDGWAVAAMLTLGAQAAQLGTAFIPCPESDADDDYRAALLGEPAEHTILTKAISGRPARGIANTFTAWGADPGLPSVPKYPLAYDAAKALNTAAKAAGNSDFNAHWAGQGANLSRAMPSAELVKLLKEEMDQAIDQLRSVNSISIS